MTIKCFILILLHSSDDWVLALNRISSLESWLKLFHIAFILIFHIIEYLHVIKN